MALILTPTQEQKIKIQGTTIELDSLYLRLEFRARMNGSTLEINGAQFINKEMFLNNTPVVADIISPQVMFDIDTTVEVQDISAAHRLLKAYYEENGYGVTIDLA
jgi:hypothetical protein